MCGEDELDHIYLVSRRRSSAQLRDKSGRYSKVYHRGSHKRPPSRRPLVLAVLYGGEHAVLDECGALHTA